MNRLYIYIINLILTTLLVPISIIAGQAASNPKHSDDFFRTPFKNIDEYKKSKSKKNTHDEYVKYLNKFDFEKLNNALTNPQLIANMPEKQRLELKKLVKDAGFHQKLLTVRKERVAGSTPRYLPSNSHIRHLLKTGYTIYSLHETCTAIKERHNILSFIQKNFLKKEN